MGDMDDKHLAFLCLTFLGVASLLTFGAEGLNVVSNVICAIGGAITGNALGRSS